MPHEVFHYHSLEEVHQTAAQLDAWIPLQSDTACLFTPLDVAGRQAANRIVFQPMEGTDGTEDGAPGPLTLRRYERFAQAGPGIIWFEAVSTLARTRASRHQLWLTENNVGEFRRLTDHMREVSLKANGTVPLIIMQGTNSGRYAKPTGTPEPLIAWHCPPLEDTPLPDACIVTDDDLKRFEAAYTQTARLCKQAGFDGMDIKSCHRYLSSELLASWMRPGPYGGSYENRTRFLKNCYRAALAGLGSTEDFFLTSRVNAYDGFPWPWGFGTREGEGLAPDFAEIIRLIGELKAEFHIPLVNITMGNPYKNPHVNRPYDHGNYVPDEHPLTGISRLMSGISQIQKAVDLPLIGSGFSYLRQFSANLAAAMVGGGHCAMAGFGREAFAYPQFVQDLKQSGTMAREKCCLSCGGCAVLLRKGSPAGCVVRDREVYKP